MGYEVDFLPVGDGSKGGDAIALRFGNLNSPNRGDQFVVVIDGGNQDSGQALVEHVKTYYGTDIVDLVINSHPDADHSSGLSVVLEKLTVKRLWMHRPWMHSSDICSLFGDRRITVASLYSRVVASLDDAHDLEKIAKRKGIPIDEPFAGLEALTTLGVLAVLGPSKAYYQSLLPDFRSTPEKKEASLSLSLGEFGTWLREGATALLQKVAESFGIETLEDPAEDATSAENNSSTILFLEVDGRRLLFTADAGVPALTRAANFAEAFRLDLSSCCFSQTPHHGSKRNVGPTILDRILGPKLSTDAPSRTAFVSVPKEGEPKHPSKKVTNAYRRRGFRVVATKGQAIRHSHQAPTRAGWVAATVVPFYDEVEDD